LQPITNADIEASVFFYGPRLKKSLRHINAKQV